jgi:hypothetical protein
MSFLWRTKNLGSTGLANLVVLMRQGEMTFAPLSVHLLSVCIVGNFETSKASKFNKLQQLSTSSLQLLQHQTVTSLKIP